MEVILLKKWWRADAIWTMPIVYKSFLRLIPLYFDTRALMKSQYWTRARLERLQEERLSELFRNASLVPYWRDTFSRLGIQKSMPPRHILANLPVTTKKGLSEHINTYTADERVFARSNKDHTSGSTGRPFHFYLDWRSSLRSYALTERIFRTAAHNRRYPIVYMRARERLGFSFYKHIWFFVRGYNSMHYRVEDLIALSRRLSRGFILYGYTSWVLEMTRQIEKAGAALPIKAVMVAGEHFRETDRDYIEHVTHAEVFSLYASREVGFLGFECEKHAMHVSEEWAYIEIVDQHDEPLPVGQEGRIVVTTFDNEVMPFIRYEIGDIGALSDTPCTCGRTLRTLRFKGRTMELIDVADGRTVSLMDISYILGRYRKAVLQFQIIQKSLLSFIVRVVPGPGFTPHKKFFLEMLLIRLLHPKTQITWDIVESIPEAKSGKAVYFIRDMQSHDSEYQTQA